MGSHRPTPSVRNDRMTNVGRSRSGACRASIACNLRRACLIAATKVSAPPP